MEDTQEIENRFRKEREKFIENVVNELASRPHAQVFVIIDDPENAGIKYLVTCPLFTWQKGVLDCATSILDETYRCRIRAGLASGDIQTNELVTTNPESKVH